MTAIPLDSACLPAMWSVKPLKAIAKYFFSNVDKTPDDTEESVRLCNYTDVYNNEFIRSSMDFMCSTATPREIQQFHLVEGDVVITKDSETWEDIAVPALVVESADDLLCGYHLAVLRPSTNQITGAFLFRCLQSRAVRNPLELAATGVTRFGLGKDDIGRLRLPIPPLDAQQQISAYLDVETARIDALMAEKERMLMLLEEKRSTLIAHAVTRGLNSDVSLKPSGRDWLGDVPAHWRLERLKFHLSQRLEQGWSPQCDNRLAEEDEWAVLKVGCVNGEHFNPNEHKALPADVAPEVRYEIHEGDVLLSRGNTIELVGRASVVGKVRPKLLLCDLLYRSRLNPQSIIPAFAVHQLRTFVGRYQIEREATGTSGSMKKIGQETVQNILLLLPPIGEQSQILDEIDLATSRIDSASVVTTESLRLLRERRRTLITAAVIGQIPVGEMSA